MLYILKIRDKGPKKYCIREKQNQSLKNLSRLWIILDQKTTFCALISSSINERVNLMTFKPQTTHKVL